MTIDEIKKAVVAGETVHWSNDGYTVTNDLLVCHTNGSCIGLTSQDGVLNGREDQFYIGDNNE